MASRGCFKSSFAAESAARQLTNESEFSGFSEKDSLNLLANTAAQKEHTMAGVLVMSNNNENAESSSALVFHRSLSNANTRNSLFPFFSLGENEKTLELFNLRLNQGILPGNPTFASSEIVVWQQGGPGTDSEQKLKNQGLPARHFALSAPPLVLGEEGREVLQNPSFPSNHSPVENGFGLARGHELALREPRGHFVDRSEPGQNPPHPCGRGGGWTLRNGCRFGGGEIFF
jgi:hypothetical protein